MGATIVEIAEYDPRWPEAFAAEAARIGSALGPPAVVIHHIGSMAVPGLAAKPIIDILIEVPDIRRLDEQAGAFEGSDISARANSESRGGATPPPTWREKTLWSESWSDSPFNGGSNGGAAHESNPLIVAAIQLRYRSKPLHGHPTVRLYALLLLFPCSLVPLKSHAQPARPAEVARAQQQLTAQDYAGAIATLEGFFQANPAAVQGRLLFADAHRGAGHVDRAIELYLAIQQPTAMRLQATFNAAALLAKKGERARSLDLLGRLKASGSWDMDLVDTSGDFASLAGDPRLEAIRFRPSDFVAPFVEPVRVIHEWVGEAKGDQFSWIARSVPDTDGDGIRDVVTSAPTSGAGANPTGPGKVYLYSGKTGRLLWDKAGAGTESLGTGLEGAGDVDRDGIGDVIAGAPGANRAYVFSGKDGTTLRTFSPNAQPGDRVGASAAGVGDQNGDGYADVLVGAPGSSGVGPGAGKAYLFSGRDGSTLRVFEGDTAGAAFGSIVAGDRARGGTLLIGAPGAGPTGRGRVYAYARQASAPKFIIESDSTGAALGAMFASVVGDVDGDRVPDVYASDFANSAAGPATGRVYLHSGADGRRLRTLTGEGPGNGFGIGSADIGDVNGDGHDDLVIGAWQYAAVAASGGKVYLFSGKDGAVLGTITGRIAGETLGFDATGAGDVDGDGVVDLLVTSSWSNVRGFRSGRMFVVSGATVAAPRSGRR